MFSRAHHIEQGEINLKPTIVVYETQFAESIHEKAYPRARRAYDVSQRLLTLSETRFVCVGANCGESSPDGEKAAIRPTTAACTIQR